MIWIHCQVLISPPSTEEDCLSPSFACTLIASPSSFYTSSSRGEKKVGRSSEVKLLVLFSLSRFAFFRSKLCNDDEHEDEKKEEEVNSSYIRVIMMRAELEEGIAHRHERWSSSPQNFASSPSLPLSNEVGENEKFDEGIADDAP